jgi:2-C-methyl-D-erythritol 2,4-cyclodiphosphate synthase
VIGNVDSVIELESPKLRPLIDAMRVNLAKVLETLIDSISIKAKTGEGIGKIGRRLAIRSSAIVLLKKL